jgi:hypothetical protein
LNLAVTLLPPSILYFASPLAGVRGPLIWTSPTDKLLNLLVPVLGYSRPFSIIVALALLLSVLFWAARGHLRVAPMAWLCIPALILIYFVLPFAARGGWVIDMRTPVLLGFTLFATTMPSDIGRREGALHVVALSILFLVRIVHITETWRTWQQDIADVREALAPVTAGSRVLSLQGDRGAFSIWHLAAFAMIDHRAFWSDAFATPSQQPVVIRAPYNASSNGGLQPDLYTSLGPFAYAATSPRPSYLVGWPDKFDYVLLLNAEQVPDLVNLFPKYLTLLNHERFAALFRVKH